MEHQQRATEDAPLRRWGLPAVQLGPGFMLVASDPFAAETVRGWAYKAQALLGEDHPRVIEAFNTARLIERAAPAHQTFAMLGGGQ